MAMANNKTTRLLHPLGFFNDHDFCYASGSVNKLYALDRPAPPEIEGVPTPVPMIYYRPQMTGRAYQSAAWVVSRKGRVLDPDAHWQDKPNKCFNVYGTPARAPQYEAAIAWASARYGITEWAKTPWGAFVPKAFRDARLKQLLAWAAEVGA